MLSNEFKGSLDSFISFSFELLLLGVKLVGTELDPSKFDTEGLAFLGPNILDITIKSARQISGLVSGDDTKQHTKRGGFTRSVAQFSKPMTQSGPSH